MQSTIDNVLIGEDDQDDFELIRSAISDAGFTVKLERAENGEILMTILGLNIPDILFLDINMPCKDGKQCLKDIRENPRYDSLPVIMYTAVDQKHDIEYCFRNRANLYALKPSSYNELQLIMKRIFSIDWRNAGYYPPLSSFVVGGQSEGQA